MTDPKTITDGKGRTWEFRLDSDAYRKILSDHRIDLGLANFAGPSGLPLMVEIDQSPKTLLNVAWSICEPRATKKYKITQSMFEEGWFGPEYQILRATFFELWRLFCQTLGRNEDAEALLNYQQLYEKQMEKALELQRSELGTTSTDSSTNTPESPESKDPAGSRSES